MKRNPDSSSALLTTPETLLVASEMLGAMRDPSRLRLLLLLAAGEKSVAELVAAEQAKPGSISARLKVLYFARLVKRRREAKHIFYSLSDEHVLILLTSILAHAAERVIHPGLTEDNHEHDL
jgi:ArsR family transcriptional regulator, lead/cadmium/zinc/bismuth-responsive transcriptional repressor